MGVARWHSDREGAIAIDRHRLGGAVFVGYGHFGVSEIRARGGAGARQRQGHRGRCRARVAQADVERGAVAFRDGWAADLRYRWAIVVCR